MFYKVLKEFVFNGSNYEVGEVLETSLSVKGLVNRTILSPLEYPKPQSLPTVPESLDERVENLFSELKDYDTNESKPQEIKETIISKPDLESLKPQNVFKNAKAKASKSVEEATKVTSPKRKPKQKEMNVSMTSLVEEATKISKKSKVPKEV